MAVDAIILGDPRGLLGRGPADLEDVSRWTKRDSDILAHFLQVCTQIQRSRWYTSEKQFTEQTGATLDVSMPRFEEFVYAAVYFRQLFMKKKDFLLKDAAERYCTHVKCPIRKDWVKHEVDSFNNLLESPTFPFPVKNYTLRQIFDAFMYGAGLMHKIPEDGDAQLTRFLDICDNHPRTRLLYALNVQLQVLMNHVGNIAVVVHQDYAYWQNHHSLPLPDVRWHERLFPEPTDTSSGAAPDRGSS
jgi:hypothetical protein